LSFRSLLINDKPNKMEDEEEQGLISGVKTIFAPGKVKFIAAFAALVMFAVFVIVSLSSAQVVHWPPLPVTTTPLTKEQYQRAMWPVNKEPPPQAIEARTLQYSDDHYAGVLINPINTTGRYTHHPIFSLFPRIIRPVEREILVDFAGLKVPSKFDCVNFNNGEAWDGNRYFSHVPSRWIICNEHYANVVSSIEYAAPSLPAFDEEYAEMIVVYQAAVAARNLFVLAEVGSRWGTWGMRALSALRLFNPLPAEVLFYEPVPISFSGIGEISRLNGFETLEPAAKITAVPDVVKEEHFLGWLAKQPHLDLLDVDIQGFEGYFSKAVIGALNAKAHRVIVGTHKVELHTQIRQLFVSENWRIVFEVKLDFERVSCHEFHVSLGHSLDVGAPTWLHRNWKTIRNTPICFVPTVYGPLCNWDGEINLRNPRLT
jgi:hypothetical protein